MVRVGLRRFSQNLDTGTEGCLILPSGVFCNTLELPRRNNKSGLSCIPPGEYVCDFEMSPKFKRKYYRLRDVPGRSGVLIHSGVWAGDVTKGLRSHVLGCILVGKYFMSVQGQRGILASKNTLRLFVEEMEEKDFILVVEDDLWPGN